MSESIKLPIWAISLIFSLLGVIAAGGMYVMETRAMAVAAESRAEEIDARLKRIETGVDQLWSHDLFGKDGR